jgi:hypothetical protein
MTQTLFFLRPKQIVGGVALAAVVFPNDKPLRD